MSGFNSRQRFPRRSLASSTHQLNARVSRWGESHSPLNDVSARDEFTRSLFQTSWDLQRTSCNLVFFDRIRGEVTEFPYPEHQSVRILPSGFKRYFNSKRLRFECFCGLKESRPKFVDVQKGIYEHFMRCDDCQLYVSLETVYVTADSTAVYNRGDPDREILPVTLSSRRIAMPERNFRRSRRRVSAPPYMGYRSQRSTDFQFNGSSTPISEWQPQRELDEYKPDVEEKVKVKRESSPATDAFPTLRRTTLQFSGSSSPISEQQLRREFGLATKKVKVKQESSPATEVFPRLSSPIAGPSTAGPSSSRPDIFQFCRYCQVGMDVLDLLDHERECGFSW